MLWNTIHMVEARECEIKGDGLWTARLRVNMGLEGLFPPPFWITLLQNVSDMRRPAGSTFNTLWQVSQPVSCR